jgi:hypothetical protein
MRNQKYIVIGRHDCERNSWLPDGDIRHKVSGHRTETAAWAAAEKAHSELGGCDGSDSLTKVMIRAPEGYDPDEYEDTYDHDGILYLECDFWGGHKIRHDGYGLVAVPK